MGLVHVPYDAHPLAQRPRKFSLTLYMENIMYYVSLYIYERERERERKKERKKERKNMELKAW